jgi:aldose 1-epimerase
MDAPMPATERVERQPFGTTRTGAAATRFVLRNRRGLVCELTDLGAALVAVHAPDRDGRPADVVLGFDDVRGYESDANQYFGCIAGRVANRIAHGRFVLDGVRHQLACNAPPHHLHGGGDRSLAKVQWQARVATTADAALVTFTRHSPDGEEGYPGNVSFTVRYVLDDANELSLELRATTDRATPVNLTHHPYWNLAGAGAGTILEHELEIAAERYLPVDATLIPLGPAAPVAGTPFDFRRPARIAARIDELRATPAGGYDHNFVLAGSRRAPAFAARLHDPRSGRVLELATTQPGLQVYSGNVLHDQTGKGGRRYARHGGVCLEPQGFPDAPNQPAFPSVILRPGEEYHHRIVYRFATSPRAAAPGR